MSEKSCIYHIKQWQSRSDVAESLITGSSNGMKIALYIDQNHWQ